MATWDVAQRRSPGELRGGIYGPLKTRTSFATLAGGVIGLGTLPATWLPARRVSRVDPVNALRSE